MSDHSEDLDDLEPTREAESTKPVAKDELDSGSDVKMERSESAGSNESAAHTGKLEDSGFADDEGSPLAEESGLQEEESASCGWIMMFIVTILAAAISIAAYFYLKQTSTIEDMRPIASASIFIRTVSISSFYNYVSVPDHFTGFSLVLLKNGVFV